MKRRNIDELIGKQLPDSKLTILEYAGADSHRYALVRCQCECGNELHTTPRLCDVLARPERKIHTTSCGCVKHKRYVEHVQKDVSQLSPDTIKQCFLSVVDSNALKPDLPKDVIVAAYYRRTEYLKFLPDPVALDVRQRILVHDDYAAIARDNSLHPAEVAWLAKQVIRPEFEKRRLVLDNIRYAKEGREYELKILQEDKKWRETHRAPFWKQDCEEWLRERELREDRFSASELHNLGTIVSKKARLDFNSLDFAFHWMETINPNMKLDSDEENLLTWLLITAEHTFKWRRDKRRKEANRRREKSLVDYEAAA